MTRHLLAVGAQPISLACRSRASDRHLNCLIRKRVKEDSVPFFYKKGMLTSTQHSIASSPNRAIMPGPVVHNETISTNLGGFVTVLANLTRRAFALEECSPVPETFSQDPVQLQNKLVR